MDSIKAKPYQTITDLCMSATGGLSYLPTFCQINDCNPEDEAEVGRLYYYNYVEDANVAKLFANEQPSSIEPSGGSVAPLPVERLYSAGNGIEIIDNIIQTKIDGDTIKFAANGSIFCDATSIEQSIIEKAVNRVLTDVLPSTINQVLQRVSQELLPSAKDYADEQDATTLQSAKDYADEQDATTLQSAKSYADNIDAKFINYATKASLSAAVAGITSGNTALSSVNITGGKISTFYTNINQGTPTAVVGPGSALITWAVGNVTLKSGNGNNFYFIYASSSSMTITAESGSILTKSGSASSFSLPSNHVALVIRRESTFVVVDLSY